MTPRKDRHGLSPALKKFYGVGDFGFNLMANVDTFYSTFFFTNIAKFSLSAIAVFTTISAIADAILSMFYGAWINKIKPPKWGRYRSWLILTPWMVPVLYALQYVKLGDGIMAITFITLAMITSRIAWNLPFVGNISMINVAGKNTGERVELSSTRAVWTALSNVLYSYIGPAVLAVFTGFLGANNAYAATAFAFAALMAAGYYAHFKMFEGYEEPGADELQRLQKEAAERKAEHKEQKVSALAAVTCNPHLIGLLLANFAKFVVMFLIYGLAIYYFLYVAHNEALFTTFMLTANLLGVVASYVARYIVKRVGTKPTVVISFFVMAAAMMGGYMVYTNAIVVIACMCVVMFALNLANTCEPELYATCSIYSSKKLGFDTTGTIMGLSAFPIKLALVARGILLSAILAAAKFSEDIIPNLASVELQRGISVGFLIVPAITMVVGALIMIFGYRLRNQQQG